MGQIICTFSYSEINQAVNFLFYAAVIITMIEFNRNWLIININLIFDYN